MQLISAKAFERRFEETRDVDDINQAISDYEDAASSAPPDPDIISGILNQLGNSYRRRFSCTSDLQDIDQAISHQQKALQLIPSGNVDIGGFLGNLGNCYLDRFKYTGNLQDIDSAISQHQNSVKSTSSGHVYLPKRFGMLGQSYGCRFDCTGDLQDIDSAIYHLQKAVELTPSGNTELGGFFSDLGSSYSRRSRHTGNLQDIDHAISHHLRAVNSTPSGHAGLPVGYCNLGYSYLNRFNHTGDLQDIDRAVSYNQNAVKYCRSDRAEFASLSKGLGDSYAFRFGHTGNPQDIDLAIFHHQKAVDLTPSGHVDLLSRLDSLGSSYARRFEHSGNLNDIDCGISHLNKVVESTPSGDHHLPGRINSLGNSYSKRFKCTGNLQDIDHAILHYQNAVLSTPSGHSDLSSRLTNLGNSYLNRFFDSDAHDFPDRDDDLLNGITSCRQAVEASGPPSIRLNAAEKVAMLSYLDDPSRCLNDFSLAISLLSEVAGLEQTIHRRYVNLHDHSNLVGTAVAAALRFNEVDLALEWLEQARCLVWNQLNQLRTPIDKLRITSPSLAKRFVEAASTLESYGTRSVLSIPSSLATLAEDIRLQNDTRNHTIHASEYQQLLEEIRQLPDFHDFLQPLKASYFLSSVPSDGPVIIFNIHTFRCDALAVIAGAKQPLHIPLTNFSFERAKDLQKTLQFDLRKQRDALDQDRIPKRVRLNPLSMAIVLKELWRDVVQPILEALGYSVSFADCQLICADLSHSQTEPPNLSDRGRIWWCPTGPLAFLPLHAAGIYGSAYQPGSCVSDFVVSSYTPTVRSLNDKFTASSTSSKCTRLVIISQPNTPGLSPIPWTRQETLDLEALMKGTDVEALLLKESEATREKVKEEMKSRSWVHFACHGVQDFNQPLESGLCLHDGRLELLEIMKEEIPNLDLAFLSACQTSHGDLKLPEEAVHLTAGMLAAGYCGVVGTMWSISDMLGPKFATEFYKYLLREGLDSSRAAYALDHATRSVRESLGEEDAAFLNWVPYVHFGY